MIKLVAHGMYFEKKKKIKLVANNMYFEKKIRCKFKLKFIKMH